MTGKSLHPCWHPISKPCLMGVRGQKGREGKGRKGGLADFAVGSEWNSHPHQTETYHNCLPVYRPQWSHQKRGKPGYHIRDLEADKTIH